VIFAFLIHLVGSKKCPVSKAAARAVQIEL